VRDDLLAGAGLAQDQHGDVARRDPRDDLVQPGHRGIDDDRTRRHERRRRWDRPGGGPDHADEGAERERLARRDRDALARAELAAAANAASPTAAATLGMQEGPAGQFIAQHCVDGSAVIVMGYANRGPWGWGPDKDPDHRKDTDGKPQAIRDDGDHFVFVWRPDQTKDLFIVMDPAWSRPLPPRPLSDVIGFIHARDNRLNADGRP
jgi:hypothetical protein